MLEYFRSMARRPTVSSSRPSPRATSRAPYPPLMLRSSAFIVCAIQRPTAGSRTRGSREPRRAAAFVTASSLASSRRSSGRYVVEAPYKRPSGVDLVWTPLGGAVFGELRFQLGRWLRGDPSNPVKSVLLIATDPFGELERRLFKTRC